MVDIASAALAVRSLKDASELVGKALSANPKESGPITEMLIAARLTLLELIEKNALLQDDVASLREQVAALEREKRHLLEFSEDSDKYERIQMPSKIFVYRERNPAGGNAGAPYFCPTCFANKKISIFQGRRSDNYHWCAECKIGFDL